jgi:hypothetical protein
MMIQPHIFQILEHQQTFFFYKRNIYWEIVDDNR